MKCKRLLLALGLAAGLVGAASGAPYPRGTTPAPADLGPASTVLGNDSITVTVALPLRNTATLQARLESTYTRGNPQYRHFLNAKEFNALFGPSDATVARVTRQLERAGLQVTRASSTLLKVTGSTSAVEAAFSVKMHAFQVGSSMAGPGYRYRAPAQEPSLPSDIASSVQAVLGLDTRPRFQPHLRHGGHGAGGLMPTTVTLPANVPQTPNMPGLWTVTDFAKYYDVDPLYAAGIDGRHRTIGIVTLAAFTPSDVFNYWSSLGLAVSPNRIKVVPVDGGAGAPSDFTGSDETTLDVQQAGGVAPGANLVVYEAPNNEQGFVDAFAAAFDDNVADTVSTSWGKWEYVDETSSVNDPLSNHTVNALRAFNDLFTQAALQGQSVFVAAGDAGAYDANDTKGLFLSTGFSPTLTVDSPASQPLVTAAGGTTLPGTQVYNLFSGQVFTVRLPQERAWSWDYVGPLCVLLNTPDPVDCATFPNGGGGGVSVFMERPFYQWLTPNMLDSIPGQALYDQTRSPPQLIFKLPDNFPGRNVPDIALNADPDTGYVVWYTSEFTGFSVLTFFGGTSFVAPQLAGVSALYAQGLGTRIGLWNPGLYGLQLLGKAYGGHKAPLRDITTGNNWFFNGRRGYDQATGLGVLDVANLFNVLD